MALYTITHSCGHAEEAQIYGTNVNGERERRAARMAAMPCRECRRAAELDAAAAWEREAGVPPEMEGSDKQVAWARRIRHGAAAGMVARANPEVRDDFVRFVASKPARYWIDGRPSGMGLAREFAATVGGRGNA